MDKSDKLTYWFLNGSRSWQWTHKLNKHGMTKYLRISEKLIQNYESEVLSLCRTI